MEVMLAAAFGCEAEVQRGCSNQISHVARSISRNMAEREQRSSILSITYINLIIGDMLWKRDHLCGKKVVIVEYV